MLEDLVDANRRFAARFDGGDLSPRASLGLGVVTCMDTRIDPLSVLGIGLGDANIVRNAGGRVTDDVLRSLVLATSYLGVDTVVVLHHSECALAHRSEDELRAGLRNESARAPSGALFAMPDPDEALASDVEAIGGCRALGEITVEGWRYDVRTGSVCRVIARPSVRR